MKKVSFYNKKGQKLVGILDMPKNKNPPIVIMLHGLNGHKTYYEFMNHLAKELPKHGFAVLILSQEIHLL